MKDWIKEQWFLLTHKHHWVHFHTYTSLKVYKCKHCDLTCRSYGFPDENGEFK